MCDLRRLCGALLLTLATVLLTACAGDGGSGEARMGADETLVGDISDATPVDGNVTVTWRNLDPRNQDVTISLVNETSDYGRRLKSGRSSSPVTRVASDRQIGRLLAKLEELGFFRLATPMEMGGLPEVPGRRGAVVVQRDGASVGLMLVLKQGLAGSQIPKVYMESKRQVLYLHGNLRGLDVRGSVESMDANAEDVFRGRPIKPVKMDRR